MEKIYAAAQLLSDERVKNTVARIEKCIVVEISHNGKFELITPAYWGCAYDETECILDILRAKGYIIVPAYNRMDIYQCCSISSYRIYWEQQDVCCRPYLFHFVK